MWLHFSTVVNVSKLSICSYFIPFLALQAIESFKEEGKDSEEREECYLRQFIPSHSYTVYYILYSIFSSV